ncbi:MAG: hypothetical protein JWO82_3351 [Akkermansiaceae bacterium]|nr:hypothetical protein [Akkermansiaceae bacterium]
MPLVSTINYASPPPGCFWKWSAGYEAIEWQDGSTLALWPEVHTVLESFGTSTGLPRFGSLLLLMAACRDDWPATAGRLWTTFAATLGSDPAASQPRGPDLAANGAIDSLFDLIDGVHRLPRELRSSMAAISHLASVVFEGGPYSILEKESDQILADLSLAGPACLAGTRPVLSAKAQLLRDCRALLTGLKRHQAQSLENLLRTGLEDTDLEASALFPALAETTEPGALLDTLAAAGGEAGAVAAVARQAIAMMNFPGHLSTPPDLPVGGIADITNRGTIDRLLPGELAWDDLVLAARLVHNEALYFRREIPPMNVAVSHTVLLSRELRLWGEGRILSLGIALGLRHHPALNGPGQSYECAAATVEDFEYLDLETRADVAAALQTLVPLDGPLQLLQSWWAAAQQLQDSALPEVSLILASENLRDAGLKALLGDLATWLHERGGQFRTIALGRGGELEIQAWSPAGNRGVFRGELELNRLLHPSRPAPTLPKSPDPLQEILPIYACEPLPVIFPYRAKPGSSIRIGNGKDPVYIGVSVEGHLMRWTENSGAGEVLCANLPGQQHWLGVEGGQPIVIASAGGPGSVAQIFHWDGSQLLEIPTGPPSLFFPRYATVSGGVVIIAYIRRAEAISLATGQRVAELDYPLFFPGDRFSYDGHRITREEGSPPADESEEPHFGMNPDDVFSAILRPDQVGLESEALIISCGGTSWEFRSGSCRWNKTIAAGVPLQDSGIAAPGGGFMKRAVIGNLEIWYDPLGLLHLREMLGRQLSWTILLAEPTASIWRQDLGLCALNPALRRNGTSEDYHLAATELEAFIAARNR